jgi:DNA polymerase-1
LPKSDKKLLLVDGMAAVYRAFFAIPPMSTADGRPSNAIFGFIRMLDQLRKVWNPSHLAVIFDGGLPQERMALVPDYKANRPPMPDDLRTQLEGINEYLDAASVDSVRIDGCEADDMMATIAVAASRDGADAVLIATHDKDLFQLVNERIKIVPVAGKGEAMGVDEIKAKTGVLPRQIVDWLAMIGDSADNIKGVPGVGPKTATRLLCEYGDIDAVIAHLDDFPQGKLRESLRDNMEILVRNRKMVGLYTEIDGLPDWRGFIEKEPSIGRLLEFYERFEFHAFAKPLREPELF